MTDLVPLFNCTQPSKYAKALGWEFSQGRRIECPTQVHARVHTCVARTLDRGGAQQIGLRIRHRAPLSVDSKAGNRITVDSKWKVAFWRHETAMGMGRSMICTRHANQG